MESFLEGKGWLTRFQIDEIREGRGDRLTFNGYQLVEKLADLPSGAVYKATHPALLEAVTFQWLDPAWLEPADRIHDFLHRAQSVSSISHPHLLNILDAGLAHGTLFIVSESIDSTDLGHLVSEMGAVPVPLACEYTRQAAVGLQAVHKRGLAHGDFSPSRMLLFPVTRKVKPNGSPKSVSIRPSPSATLKVSDAGQIPIRPAVAEIAPDQSSHLGAVGYMAPERVNRSGYDPRQDVYSLGASLYFLLSGRSPLQSTNPSDALLELQRSEPTGIETLRTDVPPGLAQLIQRMLSKDPQRRPADAGEVAAAVQRYCTLATSPTNPAPIPTAIETLTHPVPMLNKANSMATDPEPLPMAEELPGLEPLPESVTDSQVYSPRNPAPYVELLPEVEHHDPFGGHQDDGPSERQPRPEHEKMSSTKAVVLIILAIALHLAAYVMLAWYIKFWPFNASEQTTPENKTEHKTPVKKKRGHSTSALEWRGEMMR